MQVEQPVIRAVIFDLDNCLAPADEVGRDLLEPMFAAIRRTNNARLSHLALERAFEDCWRLPLDAVAQAHGFSDEMLAAGWAAACDLVVRKPMTGYGDLGALAGLPVKLFLVTSGFRKLQDSKIDALGLKSNFESLYVDAIDEVDRKGKEGLFHEILERYGFAPASVLVVGDNPESEIAAGIRLGMPTVQILRPGVIKSTTAAYYIRDVNELRRLLESWRV
jgi:FMN phosphatase YigB (HAD superfamily)